MNIKETPAEYRKRQEKPLFLKRRITRKLGNLLLKGCNKKNNHNSNERVGNLDKELLSKKKLISEITGLKEEEINIGQLSQFTEKELENIKKNKDLILEILGEDSIYIGELGRLSRITQEELKRAKKNKDLLLKSEKEIGWLDLKTLGLCQLDDELIEYCNSKNIKDGRTILLIGKVIENNRKIKEYIKRKQEYLENNRLLSDYELEKLFGGVGKYGKGEIYQKSLGYCYLYTTYEILKKMNFFDVLIKTNLKRSEDGDGWYVRLPMGDPDGLWIHVSKKEIDKNFDLPSDRRRGQRKGVSINSNSPLGFKIMEIAYIKRNLISINEYINGEFLNTGDVLLTGERISALEGGNQKRIFEENNSVFKILIGEDKTITIGSNVFNNFMGEALDDNCVDIVFDNFKKGLIVNLSVKNRGNGDKNVKLDNFRVIAKRKTIKTRTIRGILRKIIYYGDFKIIRGNGACGW